MLILLYKKSDKIFGIEYTLLLLLNLLLNPSIKLK